ncbi:unnamed protein product [Mytilus edulis]|uniref:Uncharacterized protein n=1 Tax=Mytilus edulis TaxID=6550 RepID=A0A8S3VF17_MYTED|nr:unnamed protein product [Mytilus edulis]
MLIDMTDHETSTQNFDIDIKSKGKEIVITEEAHRVVDFHKSILDKALTKEMENANRDDSEAETQPPAHKTSTQNYDIDIKTKGKEIVITEEAHRVVDFHKSILDKALTKEMDKAPQNFDIDIKTKGQEIVITDEAQRDIDFHKSILDKALTKKWLGSTVEIT